MSLPDWSMQVCRGQEEQHSLINVTKLESAEQDRDIGEVRSTVARSYWSHSDVSLTPVHVLMVS